MATRDHCKFCFDVISSHLEASPSPVPTFPNLRYPLFVTYNTIQTGTPQLRGCIGTFEPLPLHDGLERFAKTAAFSDHRFDPITVRELQSLQCGVSLLTDFEECLDWQDWNVGVHGIRIRFKDG
jgi:AMME syndrome candidate gene 1 protein